MQPPPATVPELRETFLTEWFNSRRKLTVLVNERIALVTDRSHRTFESTS